MQRLTITTKVDDQKNTEVVALDCNVNPRAPCWMCGLVRLSFNKILEKINKHAIIIFKVIRTVEMKSSSHNAMWCHFHMYKTFIIIISMIVKPKK